MRPIPSIVHRPRPADKRTNERRAEAGEDLVLRLTLPARDAAVEVAEVGARVVTALIHRDDAADGEADEQAGAGVSLALLASRRGDGARWRTVGFEREVGPENESL